MKAEPQRCPHCGQTMPRPSAKPKPERRAAYGAKEYVLERMFNVRRRNGGFV